MPTRRIEHSISCCGQYIRSSDNGDPNISEIHSHLVSSVVLTITSEYEELIEKIFTDRANRCGDTYVTNYVKRQLHDKFKSPDLGKIHNTLLYLSEDYRETFMSATNDNEFSAAWNNIMKARHAVVHKQGTCNLTFDELKNSYQKTKKVLTELVKVLGLAETIEIYLDTVPPR